MAAEFVSLADWLSGGPRAVARPASVTGADEPAGARPDAVQIDAAGGAQAETAGTGHDETCSDDAAAVRTRAGAFHDARATPADDGLHPCDTNDALRDARLFRARLADAFHEASARLLRELATDVLARELRLAPCDLSALVRRAFERAPAVRVRAAPDDLSQVTGVPVIADGTLTAGDAIVELTGGALDARLGVRLAAVLEAFA